MRTSWTFGEPLHLTAKGDAFHFVVHLSSTWTGRTLRSELLHERIRILEGDAYRAVLEKLRPIARQFVPHHTAEAEKAMTQALAGGWCYDDKELQFLPRVHVAADPRLGEDLEAASRRLIEQDLTARQSRHQADLMREVVRSWQQVLTDLGHDVTVPYAARLAASPTDFPAEVTGLTQERLARTGELQEVLWKSIEAHQSLDVYEFVTSYDSSLNAFMRFMGISPGSDSPGQERPGQEPPGGVPVVDSH